MLINTEAGFSDLRTQSIAINRTFADMEPLLMRTVYLSLNAEIASSHIGDPGKPFGIVVKELSYMGNRLDELIKEVESEFAKVVYAISKWIAVERKMTLLLKSFKNSNEGFTNNSVDAVMGSYNEEIESDPIAFIQQRNIHLKGALASYNKDSLQYILLKEAINHRKEIIDFLENIANLTNRLSNVIDKINMVAVRQSHFVAVTAVVESAQIKIDNGHIKTVANSIKELSQDIHKVEGEAKNKILAVASLSSRLFRSLKNN